MLFTSVLLISEIAMSIFASLIRRWSRPRDVRMGAIHREVLSPDAYIRLYNERPGSIAKVRPAPPKLGDKHFGGLEVTYRSPRYRALLD